MHGISAVASDGAISMTASPLPSPYKVVSYPQGVLGGDRSNDITLLM